MILFLAKFFEEEAYADDFVAGRLYLNTAEYFVEREGDGTGRADSHENMIGSFRPDDISIGIGGIDIPTEDLAAPIRYSSRELLNQHLLCMYGATNGQFEHLNTEILPDLRKHLKIPNEALAMGDWAVLVTNVTIFNERLLEGAMKAKFSLKTRMVSYRKMDELHRFIPEEDWLFTKDERFAGQREYRAVVNTHESDESSGAVIFNVGDLSDICHKMPTRDLGNLEIQVLPKEENF